MADKNNPLALIFQGLQDGIGHPNNNREIEKALEDPEVDCRLLEMAVAAHANYVALNKD